MQGPWVFSSTSLPHTGEPIEFLLENRRHAIHGTFANGLFHSRWVDYDADRVTLWRKSDPSAASIQAQVVAKTSVFAGMLAKLRKMLTIGGQTAGIAQSHSHARTIAEPTVEARLPAASTRSLPGNRISP